MLCISFTITWTHTLPIVLQQPVSNTCTTWSHPVMYHPYMFLTHLEIKQSARCMIPDFYAFIHVSYTYLIGLSASARNEMFAFKHVIIYTYISVLTCDLMPWGCSPPPDTTMEIAELRAEVSEVVQHWVGFSSFSIVDFQLARLTNKPI